MAVSLGLSSSESIPIEIFTVENSSFALLFLSSSKRTAYVVEEQQTDELLVILVVHRWKIGHALPSLMMLSGPTRTYARFRVTNS